ncbi:hypothetical protein M0804_010545 [Polistes exclamans]|nr:hypothetical protein M0804_010545 [Polistes exclamans]
MNMSIKRLDMLTKYTVYNLFVKQIQSIIYTYRKQMYSNSTSNELNYTSDHDNYILKILNNKKVDYFKRYEISQFHAYELHKYRNKNGIYKSLKDLFKIEGMTKEILDKFILSIINNKELEKDTKLKKSIVSSSIRNISQQQISTILGIYIEPNIISWTLLETKEKVLEWNYENCSQNTKHESTSQLLKLACTLNDKIPKADIYVVNDTNFNFHMVKSIGQIQRFLRKEQLKAMILAFLTQKTLSLQGREITSTATVIERLLCKTDGTNIKTKNPISVYIQQEIMQTYNKQIDSIKDQMNWSLLIALTFLQLGVLHKHDYNFV